MDANARDSPSSSRHVRSTRHSSTDRDSHRNLRRRRGASREARLRELMKRPEVETVAMRQGSARGRDRRQDGASVGAAFEARHQNVKRALAETIEGCRAD